MAHGTSPRPISTGTANSTSSEAAGQLIDGGRPEVVLGVGDYDVLDKFYGWDTPRLDIWINEGP